MMAKPIADYVCIKFTIFALAIFISLGSAAYAGNAQTEPLAIQLTMKKIVTDSKGHENLVDAPSIKPGDLVEYTATYRNRSKKAISGLNGSLPIPQGLEYIKQSALPSATMQATADGVRFGVEPLMRSVRDKNSIEQQVEVPYSEYRSLRWNLGSLDAGKRTTVSARMRVVTLPKSPEELIEKPKTPNPLLGK